MSCTEGFHTSAFCIELPDKSMEPVGNMSQKIKNIHDMSSFFVKKINKSRNNENCDKTMRIVI